MQRWVDEVKSRWRTPGDHLLEPPEGLAQAYHCDSQPFPFLLIEANELAPATLEAGREFNHHLVYFLCPTPRAEVMTGTLSRRLYYQGQVVFEDLSQGFTFKPGKWSVDAFIEVPPTATAGVYSLQWRFDSKGLHLEEKNYFVVKRP